MKTKIYNKILLPIVLAFIMITCCFLVGCKGQGNVMSSLHNRGYKINRLIYTDDVQKYIEGKELFTGRMFDDSRNDTWEEHNELGLYAFPSTDPTMADIVVDSTIQNDGDGMPRLGFLAEIAAVKGGTGASCGPNSSVSYPRFVVNTNKYLFANAFFGYNISFSSSKEDPDAGTALECKCDIITDAESDNYSCGCLDPVNNFAPQCPNGTYSDGSVPHYQYISNVPKCCYDVQEVFNEDGSSANTFSITNNCNCEIKLQGTNLSKVSSKLRYLYFLPYYASYFTSDFKELVIDGFNLQNYMTHYTNLINNFKDDPVYDQIQSLLNFNDYGYMFYQLGCEKISLNNVTFPAEYPVQSLSHMFDSCLNLREVNFGNFFDNVQPTDINHMFYNCPKLSNIDLSTLDSSKTTNMSNMFATFNTRDDALLDIINTVIIPEEMPEYNTGTAYTWDQLCQAFGSTKEGLLLYGVLLYDINVPVTYDEFCLARYNAPYETVLNDPASYDIDKTTTEEVHNEIITEALSYGVTRLYDTIEEVNALYTAGDNGILRLGGAGSKFVVSSGTNVSNMFGNIAKFSHISAPTIAEGIEIALPDTYNISGALHQSITSASSNSNFVLGEQPDPVLPPADEPTTPTTPTKNNSVLWWVIGGIMGLVVIATIVVFSSFSVHKRKNKDK